LYPNKFTNVTNGIAHRRWLCQSNPRLTKLLDDSIGTSYYYDADDLQKVLRFAEDKSFLTKLAKAKFENKKDFADYLFKKQGVEVDPNARFDVHVKRIHEYKRQLLNVLKIIHLYAEIIENPEKEVTPQVFFFGGKSASKYYMAKRIIKLICKLSKDIDNNPLCNGKIKVVFLENYNVSMAEKIIPATDVSEQISLAGKEASGTGNMKFMINGALTLGTYDGANVEMTKCVGRENIFIFGLTADKVDEAWKIGYDPKAIATKSKKITRVLEMLRKGFDGEKFEDIADYLVNNQRPDPYMCLVDFDSYIEAHEYMDSVYHDFGKWNSMVINNIAKAGFFAADRSIEDYAKNIWKMEKY
jgi:starch phosphorylase